MPLPYHLIDGYNLLHAADLARSTYGPGDLERARYALLARIADGLDESARARTTVVFDAADPPPDADRGFRFRGMAVRFSVETGDADAHIENLIRQHSSPRQLRVVSDDNRLQRAAKRRGAQAVKSEAFLRRLQRNSLHSRPEGTRPNDQAIGANAEPGEVAGWLDYFGLEAGGVSVEPLVSDPRVPQNVEETSPPKIARNQGSPEHVPSSPSPASKSPRQAENALPDNDSDPSPPQDDLAFWQRRVDEAIDQERQSSRRRPDPG
ncbi:MAG: NYN domain-containing protein [Planctomycetota bacterium]|nr:NYN domain-containing protein [Planctomycetaceae bacterium]MDQ3332702.1 NYN domain-containing protein [Planctomycetota bacterium]